MDADTRDTYLVVAAVLAVVGLVLVAWLVWRLVS
jgi:hypothetical protein